MHFRIGNCFCFRIELCFMDKQFLRSPYQRRHLCMTIKEVSSISMSNLCSKWFKECNYYRIFLTLYHRNNNGILLRCTGHNSMLVQMISPMSSQFHTKIQSILISFLNNFKFVYFIF